MIIKLLNKQFCVCQINSVSDVNFEDEFCFLGKTNDELSLVCSKEFLPQNALKCENGWIGFKVEGVLDFSLIGILANISNILAQNKISIFVNSTYNTDYILIKETEKNKAILALEQSGYTFAK